MGAERKNELHVHLGKVKNRRNAISLTSNNPFFKNKKLVYSISFDSISLRVATIDDTKRIVTPYKISGIKGESYHFTFVSYDDFKYGDYLIDEDSMNEDEITIYLNEL